MLGWHRALRPPARVFFEYLRVELTDNGLSHFARPLARSAVEFKLVELVDRELGLGNPEHDFPRRLDDRAGRSAREEGTFKGEDRVEEWSWNRSTDPGSGVE
jgi:hypothetical protein